MNNNMNLSFLHKYDKIDMIQFLSFLMSMRENSNYLKQIHLLLREAILSCNGNKHIDILEFEKEINANWDYNSETESQKDMFIETISTPNGSFSTYTGLSEYHYNLKVLLEIASYYKITDYDLRVVYLLLDISNNLIIDSELSRYEIGDNESVSMTFPSKDTYQKGKSNLVLEQERIQNILNKFDLPYSNIIELIYNPQKSDQVLMSSTFEENNPLDYCPFYYMNNGDLLIISPESLLTTAYAIIVNIYLQNGFTERKLISTFFNYQSTQIAKKMEEVGFIFMWQSANTTKDVLHCLYMFSDNKAVILTTICNLEEKLSHTNMFSTSKNKALTSKLAYSIEREEKKLKKLGFDYFNLIVPIYLSNQTRLRVPPDSLVFDLNDLNIILSTMGRNPNRLYSYYIDRMKINSDPFSQERDKWSFYMDNKKTFYSTVNPAILFFSSGIFLKYKAKYLIKWDTHMIKYEGKYSKIKHHKDFPQSIPIYMFEKEQLLEDFVILKLQSANIVISSIDNTYNEEQKYLAYLVAKSIAIWIFTLEYKINQVLIIHDISIDVVILHEEEGYKPIYIERVNSDTYKIIIHCLEIGEKRIKQNEFEHKMINVIIEAITPHINPIKLEEINNIFIQCNGTFLQQIGSDLVPLKKDTNASYQISERWCDVILEDIAEYLNYKESDKILNVEESKATTMKILEYLNSRLFKIISEINTKSLLIPLLELHHGTIFWIHTIRGRYNATQSIFNFLDINDDAQYQTIMEYTGINHYTKCIIENMIIKGNITGRKKWSVDQIDEIFAIIKHLDGFGRYLDMFTFGGEGFNLRVLPNGRVVLPIEEIEKRHAYYYRMLDDELNLNDSYNKVHKYLDVDVFDFESDSFQEIFNAEFGITYRIYLNIINYVFEFYMLDEKAVTVCSEDNFKADILKGSLSDEEYDSFKESFFLYPKLKDMIGKDELSQFRDSDLYPNRYNRKLSVSYRPFILLGDKIYFSAKSVYQSVFILYQQIEEGKYRASSKELISFLSKINNKKGTAFTEKIEMLYKSYDSLASYREKDIGPNKILQHTERLGDIDILIINKGLKHIICLEAKNYVASRTFFDMERDSIKIQKDLEKVKRRDEWCKQNIHQFKMIDSNIDESYSISTILLSMNVDVYRYIIGEQTSIKLYSAIEIIENPLVIFE